VAEAEAEALVVASEAVASEAVASEVASAEEAAVAVVPHQVGNTKKHQIKTTNKGKYYEEKSSDSYWNSSCCYRYLLVGKRHLQWYGN
jgi:hypothetical protein